MSVAWPWVLVALVVPVALIWRAWPRSASTATSWIEPSRSAWGVALVGLGAVLLVVAAARPQAAVALPRIDSTLVIALDNSGSMQAPDSEPTRFRRAQALAHDLVDRQGSRTRIAVVAFASGGTIVQPATVRHDDVHEAIDRLDANGGTSLADGLLVALGEAVGEPIAVSESLMTNTDIGWHAGDVIAVLSDGESRRGSDPRGVARLSAGAGVRVFTIGVGTTSGSTLDLDGFSIVTALDDEPLRAIASLTGGLYTHESHVDGVADHLDTVSDALSVGASVRREHTEVSALFVLGGLLSSIVGAGLSLRRTGRVV